MNYELAKRLKDAGFPIFFSYAKFVLEKPWGSELSPDTEHYGYIFPTLEELLDQMPMRKKYLGTVNDAHFVLRKLVTVDGEEYLAAYEDEDTCSGVPGYEFWGSPTEAVANLWLAINSQKAPDQSPSST